MPKKKEVVVVEATEPVEIEVIEEEKVSEIVEKNIGGLKGVKGIVEGKVFKSLDGCTYDL